MKLGRIGVVLMLVLTLGMSGCAGTNITPSDIVNDIACVTALASVGISIGTGVGAAAAIGIIQSQGPAIAQACAAMIASFKTQVNAQIAQQKLDYAKTHAAAGPGRKMVVPVVVK